MPTQKSKSKVYPSTSSDAVLWEGEDLPCINVCTGDSVSDITYKLCLQISAMKTAYSLKDLDLKCIFQACIACPEPEKTLQNVLALIINKICSIDDIISGLNSSSSTADDVVITLASCFLPQFNSEGDPITKLAHSDYTRLIAKTVCTVVTEVDGLSTRITATEEEIAEILTQLNTIGGIPKVSPSCVAPTNAPIEITQAFTLLEKQFCELRNLTGTPDDIAKAIGKQPTTLADSIQLSSKSSMSTLSGWKTQVSTEADSYSNMWLTVMDMRGALRAVLDNCCKVNCDSIIVDFSVKLDDSRTTATLYFASMSKIPVGFSDCDPKGNILTISDSTGNMVQARIKVADQSKFVEVNGVMSDPGITIQLDSLDTFSDYTFAMEACMTNGDMTCQKCINKNVTYKNTCAYCEITGLANHSGDISGELIIVYEN